MQKTVTTIYCDKCGKDISKSHQHCNMVIYYKSIVWGIVGKKIDLCSKCADEYFKAVKPFLNKRVRNEEEPPDDGSCF